MKNFIAVLAPALVIFSGCVASAQQSGEFSRADEQFDDVYRDMNERATGGAVEPFIAYIGEKGDFQRLMGARHFGCGTPMDRLAEQICGAGVESIIKPTGGFGGNRCGYTFLAIACHRQ